MKISFSITIFQLRLQVNGDNGPNILTQKHSNIFYNPPPFLLLFYLTKYCYFYHRAKYVGDFFKPEGKNTAMENTNVDGTWIKHGKSMSCINSTIYEGDYKHGKRDGKGQPRILEGNWEKDKFVSERALTSVSVYVISQILNLSGLVLRMIMNNRYITIKMN